MIKLSIITINLNNKEGLRKTIESVISQTFIDYEYIIIDGASTDGSIEVIKENETKISYWVSEPDKGIYNAMNKGIFQAKGEYCLFMNSGDLIANEHVLSTVFSVNFDEPIIFGSLIKQYRDRQELDKGAPYINNANFTLKSVIRSGFNHQASFIKRELFERYGLYREDYKIIADWVFFLETIGLHAEKVHYIDLPIAIFDMYGFCNVNERLIKDERQKAMEQIIPASIYKDYIYLFDLQQKYDKFAYVLELKPTFFIARVVNKFLRLLGKK